MNIKSIFLFLLTLFLVVASLGIVTYKSWYPYFNKLSYQSEPQKSASEIDFASLNILNKLEKIGHVETELSVDKGPVIVNFWASWCSPCVQETPDLIELAHKNPSLKILFVSADSNKQEIMSFLSSFQEMNGAQTRVLWDEKKEIMNMFQVQLLPESFLYDQNLKFKRHIKGAVDWKNLDLNDKSSSY